MQFDTRRKIAELKRELGMRRHVYPKRVEAGSMRQPEADEKIALIEAMIADYEAIQNNEQPGLF